MVEKLDNRSYMETVEQWKQKEIKNAADFDAVLSNFRILFAYHSAVIENPEITYHATREIFENGKVMRGTAGYSEQGRQYH